MKVNTSKPPSLRDLQVWMRWVIVDPRGVDEALSDPGSEKKRRSSRYAEPKVRCLPFISNVPPMSQAERLSVYAEGYFARLLEVLAQDFRATQRLVGEADFMKLCAEYLKRHPSHSFNAADLGRDFPKFVAQSPISRRMRVLHELSYLEWVTVRSFYARETPPFDSRQMASFSEWDWDHARLKLNPSCFLIAGNYPVANLWTNRESVAFKKTAARMGKGKFYAIVFRYNGEVRVENIDRSEFDALSAMARGLTLGAVCRLLSEKKIHAPNQITKQFSRWIGLGLISGIRKRKKSKI